MSGNSRLSEEHGGNRRDGVCLEKVGRHSCTVTDVVADVVGDRRRISRIVLGDACLDLADQVRADISAFREDTTPEPREDGYQASAEAESDECDDGVLVMSFPFPAISCRNRQRKSVRGLQRSSRSRIRP